MPLDFGANIWMRSKVGSQFGTRASIRKAVGRETHMRRIHLLSHQGKQSWRASYVTVDYTGLLGGVIIGIPQKFLTTQDGLYVFQLYESGA